MIKINLLAERKVAKAKKAPAAVKFEGLGGSRNVILVVIVVLGLASAGLWWFVEGQELKTWEQRNRDADEELRRLEPILKKAKLYEQQKELLEKKINLITELKKKQEVPVHILDQISRNLPDFLWLNKMTTDNERISISGRATTYNAVSNFYKNLTSSGYFADVTLGRTFEGPEGVSFSLTCKYAPERETEGPAEAEG